MAFELPREVLDKLKGNVRDIGTRLIEAVRQDPGAIAGLISSNPVARYIPGAIKAGVQSVQDLPRSGFATGQTFDVARGKQVNAFTPKTKAEKAVFGTEPIVPAQYGKPSKYLQSKGVPTDTAERLSAVLLAGSVASNLTPGGPGKKKVAEKAADEVAKRAPSLFTRLIKGLESPSVDAVAPAVDEAAESAPDAVQKFTSLIKEAKPVRQETELLQREERARRAAQLETAFSKGEGRSVVQSVKPILSGDLPKGQFEPFDTRLGEDDVADLFNRVSRSPTLDAYQKVNATFALENMLSGARVPQRSEIALLERVFGQDFAQVVLKNRPGVEKLKDNLVEAINLPRQFISSIDMSAPLRQGLVLTVSKPKQSLPALKDMAKAFFSDKAFKAVEDDILTRPNAQEYRRVGLSLTSRNISAPLHEQEEAFIGRAAQKIPIFGTGIKASERAYVTYLNKLRADVYDDMATKLETLGVAKNKNMKAYYDLAKYINNATGRGDLGAIEPAAEVLNGIFFSPRYQASRVALLNPIEYAKLDPAVRKEAMKNTLITAGAITSVLSLAALAGADVETDPRSSDFAKVKVGNTRMDVSGGFQPWIRFAVQLATGQRKSISTGEVSRLSKDEFPYETRLGLVGRFARSKLSPALATLFDSLAGENVVGEEVTLGKEAAENIVPLYLQDALAAIEELGPESAAFLVPGFFGAGVSSYGTEEGGSKATGGTGGNFDPNDLSSFLESGSDDSLDGLSDILDL